MKKLIIITLTLLILTTSTCFASQQQEIHEYNAITYDMNFGTYYLVTTCTDSGDGYCIEIAHTKEFNPFVSKIFQDLFRNETFIITIEDYDNNDIWDDELISVEVQQ